MVEGEGRVGGGGGGGGGGGVRGGRGEGLSCMVVVPELGKKHTAPVLEPASPKRRKLLSLLKLINCGKGLISTQEVKIHLPGAFSLLLTTFKSSSSFYCFSTCRDPRHDP